MVLPKTMRLKGHRCFDHLYRDGTRYHEPSILLRVVKAENKLHKSPNKLIASQACRCAIAISSKVNKKAVIRNEIRRKMHTYLTKKLSASNGFCDYWALFSLKPQSAKQDWSKLLKECDQLLSKAGLLG